MQPPDFWQRGGPAAALLAPLGALYGWGARLRMARARPWHAPVPVVCAGNLTVGGAGKTPTALAVAAKLQSWNRRVAFLSRGYGGALEGPVQVDPTRHAAADVGDEPLLLARQAPTWIAADRAAGARRAAEAGADVIVMDDGLQNPDLAKDLSIVVIDGGAGFGNGRVLPAGPLREPLGTGLARADAFVLVGEDRAGARAQLPPHVPVLTARLVPAAGAAALRGRKVFAFAGIGRPAKFLETLGQIGAEVVAARTFRDHHPYSAEDGRRILDAAQAAGATPVTTAKDHVRLPPGIRPFVTAVDVALAFDDPAQLEHLLRARIAAARAAAHG